MIIANLGYNKLLSFQKGGVAPVVEENPKERIYVLAKIMKVTKQSPKSGDLETIDAFIDSYPKEKQLFSEEFKSKSSDEVDADEDFKALSTLLADAAKEMQLPTSAAKGAKLKQLQNSKKRKCSCGCDLVITRGKGGKITETCSCNCKGGKMKKK